MSGWTAAIAVIALYGLSAWWHVRHGALNPDEGFYAIATRAVAQGELPYRDFGFTQPPLVLYANSIPLSATGFGLFAQRALNGLWAAATLALAAATLSRAVRPAWGFALAGFCALSSPWMYFMHLGKTYAFTAFLVMVAGWVFLQGEGPRRNFLLGLLVVAGFATRLPAVPFFAVLWLLALWPGRRPAAREVVGAVAGAAVAVAIAVLPFAILAAENARFWVFDFHRISVPEKTWRLQWQEIATLAPAAWLLGLLALVRLGLTRRFADRRVGLLAAATAALAANLLPGGVYEEYAVPFLLPFVVATAGLVADALAARTIPVLCLFPVLLAAQLGTAPWLFRDVLPERRGTVSAWLPYNAPPYNRELPHQLAAARELVANSGDNDAPFVGPHLILAAETGRPVPPELRMGPFAYTSEMPAERAAGLRLADETTLERWFSHPSVATLGLFPNARLNYSWSMPSFALLPDAVRQARFDRLLRDYEPVLMTGDFFILRRRPPP